MLTKNACAERVSHVLLVLDARAKQKELWVVGKTDADAEHVAVAFLEQLEADTASPDVTLKRVTATAGSEHLQASGKQASAAASGGAHASAFAALQRAMAKRAPPAGDGAAARLSLSVIPA